jgi:cytochrome c oxidase assembly protein subunit 15
MVFLMVIIGGLTRLTESGLSMTNWKPVTGLLPPMDVTDWEKEFASYKQSPEFQKKNNHMELADFKNIFWLEFIHRLLGRLVGVVFFVPLFYFVVSKKVISPLSWKLFGIFILGGLQGVIGWYMVKSGLVDDPRVSPFRLALHLGVACVIFALLFWQALSVCFLDLNHGERGNNRVIKWLSMLVTVMIFIQIIAGAFVAGLDAGLTYNTFPLMDGDFMPRGYEIGLSFSDIATIQFNHRWFAFVTLFAVIGLWLLSSTNRGIRLESTLLLAMVLVQISLGIATLLYVVPVSLASMHQAVALMLFAVSLFINWKLCAKSSG